MTRFPPSFGKDTKTYIKKYFPILYKIIDLRHPSETAETGGGGNAEPTLTPVHGLRIAHDRRETSGQTAENADWVGTVDWDETDRQRLEDRFNWKTRPDSDVIRLRQEDLWVYKTLLQVITRNQ